MICKGNYTNKKHDRKKIYGYILHLIRTRGKCRSIKAHAEISSRSRYIEPIKQINSKNRNLAGA
jgi:hypothetical protein